VAERPGLPSLRFRLRKALRPAQDSPWSPQMLDCRKQFTVKVGTVFESAHVPLHKCLQAVHLLCSSKKGISAHQLHACLRFIQDGVVPCSSHPRGNALWRACSMGGPAASWKWTRPSLVKSPALLKKRGYGHKNAVLSLVDRANGEVRSFHVEGTKASDLIPIIKAKRREETAS